ncbi:MAG: hypothetical protein ACFCGT_00150 [Sandaracinaceae bacterium]
MRRPLRLHLALLALASAGGAVLAAHVVPVAKGQDRQRTEAELADEDVVEEEVAVDEDVEDPDVDTDVRTEGGEKVKVFRFSGLDVTGRLKSPQLLYILNRLRAEFGRPRLPHRSFLPELQRSTKGRTF